MTNKQTKQTKPYYGLFVRGTDGRWSYEFGSFDKGDVTYERDDFRDHGFKLKDLTIIKYDGSDQTMRRLLSELNGA